ncbi:MAG TPA: LytTR family DNA-binding domain-containing protein [Caulobacteraceae bacterium]|jgi:hypothetical protein|nr:LytTR family DNA-binding domain-containing protein [Caulobacteraceae bacterium]
MSTLAEKATGAGAGRPHGGDGRPSSGSSGALAGTSGAYLVAAGLVVLIDIANVLTAFHDARGMGMTLTPWRPPLLEASSGVAMLLALPIVPRVAAWAGPARPAPLRFATRQLAGALAFCAAHLTVMLAIRFAVFALAGLRYGYGPGAVPYDLVKDMLAYVGFAGVFWVFRQFGRGVATAAPAQPAASALVDIREGQRLLRTPAAEILAVRAAGNYVEFLLASGERPLMRETLAATQRRFAGLGFVRTHRSWLVNAARVRGLEPEGSGDFGVDLGGGVRAPLSRRFPQALAALRGEAA